MPYNYYSRNIKQTFPHVAANPAAPYHTWSGGYSCYASPAGDVIVGGRAVWHDGLRHERLVCQHVDGRVLWQVESPQLTPYLGRDSYYNNCYDPRTDRVLSFVSVRKGSGADRIEERNAATGQLLRTLTGTDLGAFRAGECRLGGATSAVYDPHDPERIWISLRTSHVVLRTDWHGRIDYQFGVYDQPGDDDHHLREPKGLATKPPCNAGSHFVALGDRGNHRVLLLDALSRERQMPSIFMQMPFPNPSVSYLCGTSILALYNGGADPFYGTFVKDDYLPPQPRWVFPQNTDLFVSHPTRPWVCLLAWGENTHYEVDLSQVQAFQHSAPTSAGLFRAACSDGRTSLVSPPVVTWYRPRNSLFLRASAKGVARIMIAQLGAATMDGWNGRWLEYDEMQLTPNRLVSYTPAHELSIYRVEVQLPQGACVDGWVNLAP